MEHLSYDKQQYYEIMVSAYDCGQKRAKESVRVQIHVKPMCKPGWQGSYVSHLLYSLSFSLRVQQKCIKLRHVLTSAS